MIRARQRAIADAIAVHIFVAGKTARLLQIRLTQHFSAIDRLVRIRERVRHPVVHPQVEVRHHKHRRLEPLGEIKSILCHGETLADRVRKQHDVLGVAVTEKGRREQVALRSSCGQAGRGPDALNIPDHRGNFHVIRQPRELRHQRDARTRGSSHRARTRPSRPDHHAHRRQFVFGLDDGKRCFAIVQAEDELAAVGMVIGAAWAGARSMTATAGPGISLMAEFTGLAYYVEIPAVIWDIQRVGPSTGLPTRTSQGDLLSTAFLSHGDTKHLLLFPNSVSECFTMAQDAFDLAERFQTPVFVMSDLDLGMNNWMSDPFPYPDKPIDRGKVLSKADLEKAGSFARYKDVDGDGVGYRTLPGTDHPLAAYFARGSGHNEKAQYSESPDDFERNMERINKKFETARSFVPRPELTGGGKAKIGILAYGTTHWAITESRDQLSKEHKLETDYLRVLSYAFTREVHDFIERHDRVDVVEQNRDGQMASPLKLDIKPELTPRLRSICHIHGLPIDARSVTDEFMMMEGK